MRHVVMQYHGLCLLFKNKTGTNGNVGSGIELFGDHRMVGR